MSLKVLIFILSSLIVSNSFSQATSLEHERYDAEKEYSNQIKEVPDIIHYNLVSLSNSTSNKVTYEVSSDNKNWITETIESSQEKNYTVEIYVRVTTGQKTKLFLLLKGKDYYFNYDLPEDCWLVYEFQRE